MKKCVSVVLILVLFSYVSAYALSKGSKGEDVVKLQQELINQGYLFGSADGDYGNKTASAVLAFQKATGLPETGEADDQTLQALYGDSTSALSAGKTDDFFFQEILIGYAGSLAKISYNQIKSDLDALGCSYDTTIGADELATFKVACDEGSIYIACYPLGYDDEAFGNPDREMLSVVEYSRGDKWVSVSDSMHINGGKFNTGDKGRDPVNVEVTSIDDLIEFYNNEIGGEVLLTNNLDITTDSDRQRDIEYTVERRIKEYLETTLSRIEVNSNVGTSDPDDFLILIYLKWDMMNGVERTRTMLEMYSDDMAATLAEEYTSTSDIVLFWEVPYLVEKGTCAKYAYTVHSGKAYRTDTVGPLYN